MKQLGRFAVVLMLAVLIAGLAFGGAARTFAQDTTPTPEATEEPTQEPTTESTAEATVEATAETTPEATLPAAPTTAATDATVEPTVAATDAGRPAHIHTGTCNALGGVVQPLTNLVNGAGGVTADGDLDDLVDATDDETEPTPGAEVDVTDLVEAGPVLAEYSFTSVPLALTDILAGEHAVNVHESTENISTYIACGEIGGTPDANGSVVIGLRELSDSGFTGIAVLTASADGASTDVSVFIAQVADDDGEDDDLDLEADDDDDGESEEEVGAGAAEVVTEGSPTP
jgi:hypothetical protein